MAQELYCEGQAQKQPYRLDPKVSSYTITLPQGRTLCTLGESVNTLTWQWTDFDALWEGTVQPGNQTVALRLGTGW